MCTNFGKISFSYGTVQVWNSLPNELLRAENLQSSWQTRSHLGQSIMYVDVLFVRIMYVVLCAYILNFMYRVVVTRYVATLLFVLCKRGRWSSS